MKQVYNNQELHQLREENKLLTNKLMEQYALNNQLLLTCNQKLQLQMGKKEKLVNHYDFDSEESIEESDPGPLLQIGQEDPSMTSSTVNLRQQITGGAVIINPCKCYAIRIYIHYWFWQIPILIANIILYYIYISNNNVNAELGFLAVGPVFFATLIRDKMFCWIVYWIIKHLYCCNKYGRYHFSRLADCIGGLHASFGITAYVWNGIYFYDVFRDENFKCNAITITAITLPTLLLLICLSAAPCFRYYYHNSFELIHRYLNWLSLSLLILHVYFVNKKVFDELNDGDNGIKLLIHLLVNTPSIFAFGLVVLTLYPWLIMHKIKGKNVEIIPANTGSSTALIFPIWSPMGAVCKLSLNGREFHVMGISPLPFDQDNGGHRSLILVKSLGDWSQSLTLEAKTGELHNRKFWIHRIKPPNFSQGLFNWNKVFALATGAGIAPLIPYVIHTQYFKVQISLVWVARDHANNYPEFIIDILKPLPNVILYDTTKQKRADLPLLTVEKATEFKAEAVFIVSNPKIAYNVANYVNKKGIPVFASNFDV